MDIASVTIFSGYGPANAVRTGMDVSNIVLMILEAIFGIVGVDLCSTKAGNIVMVNK